jgi:hypothetical protein
MQALRARRLLKSPGVAESIDWVDALSRLRQEHLDIEAVEQTLGCILKDEHDLRSLTGEELSTLVQESRTAAAPAP